jgi:Ca2+:H+ antiporter
VQTIRHRDYFLPPGVGDLHADAHAASQSRRQNAIAFGLLLLALTAVVLLAKQLSHPLADAISAAALPRALVGIVIAALVLAPVLQGAVHLVILAAYIFTVIVASN